MQIKSGASGGPVLRGVGIIGVNSRGFEFAEQGDDLSWITPISEIFDLEVRDSDGRTFTVLELMKEGHMPFINY